MRKKRRLFFVVCILLLVSIFAEAAALTLKDEKIDFTFIDTREKQTVTPSPKSEEADIDIPSVSVILPNYLMFANVQTGDIVELGTIRVGEPVQWIVTDINEGINGEGHTVKVLELLSLYAVKCEQYHNHYAKTTWGNSWLREEINKLSFLSLTSDERACLFEKENTDSTGMVKDKVWIPDKKEYERILPVIKPVVRGFTENADSYRELWDGIDGWWLRGTGDKSVKTDYVSGACGATGETYVDHHAGVRLMVKLMVLLP